MSHNGTCLTCGQDRENELSSRKTTHVVVSHSREIAALTLMLLLFAV